MAAPDVLQLQGVCRVFPRDVGESAAAIWREMLLPRGWLPRAGAHGLPALDGVDLAVPAGRCVGVLGAHRSGKSTLAAIAAGVLAPTSGRVRRPRRCVLVARPTAGFKPGLTVRENLRLLGVLHGLSGDPLARLLEEVLARCGVGSAQADAATGNLSPQVVRPLALGLLLGLPADLLVVDGITAAGSGDLRWLLHGQLRERLSTGTALVLSADALFLREVAACVHLLERGRLAGPFAPGEILGLYPPWLPGELADDVTHDLVQDAGPDTVVDALEEAAQAGTPRAAVGRTAALALDDTEDGALPAMPWQLLGVRVDGEAFCHAQASLLRRPGERMRVELDLRPARCLHYAGGRFELHGGSSGLPVGRWDALSPGILLQAGERACLRLDLRVPDAGEDFCGLSFTPAWRGPRYPPGHRLKVLIYGVGRRHARAGPPRLDITCLSFETERNASHVPAPASVAAPAPAQGQPAARQVG